jgi:carbonyl reductase 1
LYSASRAGANLALQSSRGVHFRYPKLDLTDPSSIEHLAKTIEDEHGNVDVLFNVAGLNITKPQTGARAFPDNKRIMDVNYQGTLNMCATFLPIMKPGSRIVNLSSVASSLQSYNEELQARFGNSKMTIADLQILVEEYEVGKASVEFHEED